MKKMVIITLLGIAALSTALSADAKRGQHIFLKKLKMPCSISSMSFAMKHTQDEWEAIKQAGKFEETIIHICPKALVTLPPKYKNDLYDFVYEYASDSGNVTSL